MKFGLSLNESRRAAFPVTEEYLILVLMQN
jgi:hypothetical protein